MKYFIKDSKIGCLSDEVYLSGDRFDVLERKAWRVNRAAHEIVNFAGDRMPQAETPARQPKLKEVAG